jgi:hypothetical protein
MKADGGGCLCAQATILISLSRVAYSETSATEQVGKDNAVVDVVGPKRCDRCCGLSAISEKAAF